MSAEASFHCRRRRRTYSEEESPLSGWKIGVVIGIIIMCFAMLYPSMLHPLVSSFFLRAPPIQKATPNRPPVHPAMNSPRPRPDIHPGMRMATSQPEISTPPSSKGIFAWMLPIYTVGVVAFLIYTLIKSKKKRRSRRHDYSSSETDTDDDYDHIDGRFANTSSIGKRKLKGLQVRLRQTEIAMEKILEQLNIISAETANAAKYNSLKENEGEKPSKQCLDREEGKTEQYLHDLEKALRDFKQLSKSYKKQGQDEGSASDADLYNDESVDEDGIRDVNEHCTSQNRNCSREKLRKRAKNKEFNS